MATKKSNAKAAVKATSKKRREKYGKELVRIGIRVDNETAVALDVASELEGVYSADFYIDRGNGYVWLVYAIDDQGAYRRLARETADLPMKMAGFLKMARPRATKAKSSGKR